MTKYEVEEKTVEYLKTVFDPEIPVNVWDLGMIYKIDVTPHIAPSDSPKGEGNRPDGNTSPLGEDGKGLEGLDIVALYKTFYEKAAFTHYSDKALDLKQVVNTNKALVHVEVFGRKVVLTSMIDNLLKGAVGQAVQNMNIMFGIDERAGLNLKASAF